MEILNKQIRCSVAEGPLWDDKNNKLFFVDILGKCIFMLDYLTGKVKKYNVGQQIGCIALPCLLAQLAVPKIFLTVDGAT